jgi:transcriptional regulator with XRE-family HTH domain
MPLFEPGQRVARSDSPLRGVRLARGLGLREAARLAGIDASHLLRVERGEAGLSVSSLQHLADVLELPVAKLLAPYVDDDR